MKNTAILLFLMIIGISNLSAQEIDKKDSLSLDEIKLVGVWKVDLSEQKNKLDAESKAQVNQLDSLEQEKFWNAAESRVYALDGERNFVMTWVTEGAHHEVVGNWRFGADTRILGLFSENEWSEYQVEFIGKDQIWIPVSKSREDFEILYIKGIGL